ncbi:MAG: FlgD immunoglobulin-like domain containing protein [Candidatus Electryonea clarkiae]|nr:FlgD immunoglobulin-like domain containing protein [Candidatus Electryonea clarkiae]MDP8285481.1 FlgD immunoglobulin-like domain containing protein [Candidatus Electryonea clarkiae]
MRYQFLNIVIAGLAVIAIVSAGSAQDDFRIWEPENGVPVRQGYHIGWQMNSQGYLYKQTAKDADGNLCIVWADGRTGGIDIYGQKITPEGGEEWDEGGLLLANGHSRQEDPNIMASSDGGWILTWVDYRFDVDIEDVSDIWMQKFNSDGEPQWQYHEEPMSWGIPIARIQGKQIAVRTISDGDGGGIAVWQDARNGSADIYCQRVDSNGEAPEGWTDFAIYDTTYGIEQAGNLMVAGGEENQGTLEGGYTADTDGAGGIIVGWKDRRDRNNQNLYAQLVSFDGDLMWDPVHPDSAHGTRGIPICLEDREQDQLQLCADGEGGAFFVWKDDRDDFAGDIYGQRVDADGNILWTEDGDTIVAADASQYKHRVVNTAPGEAIILWEDQREGGFYSDLRMQKLSGNEELELNWGEVGQELDGLILCDSELNQNNARIIHDGMGGAVICWQDERINEYPSQDIYANRINTDGEKLWDEENGIVVCNAELGQTGNSVQIMGDVAGIVWLDHRYGFSGLHYQRFDLVNGEALETNNGELIVQGLDYNAYRPHLMYDGTNIYLGYNDYRLGRWGKYCYLNKLNFDSGENLWREDGITVTPGYPFDDDTVRVSMDSVVYAMNDDGDIFSAWHDNRNRYYYVIAAQKLDSEGNVLWGNRGSVVAPPEGEYGERDQLRPKILPADDGGLFLSFLKWTREDFYLNVLIQRLDSNGDPQWTDNEHNAIEVTDISHDHFLEGMKYFDDGSILVVFNRTVSPINYDIFAQRISEDGELLWDEPLAICTFDSTVQYRAKLENVHDGILIAWEDQRRGSPTKDIFGQIINPDGTVRWAENGLQLIAQDNQQHHISLGVRNDNAWSFWLAWQDSRDPRNLDIYAQRFDLDGNGIFDPASGIRVGVQDDDIDQNHPRVFVGNEQDAYIVGEQGEGDFSVDLLYTHLDSDGELISEAYSGNGLVLCNAYHQQVNPVIISDREGGFIATWEDWRSTGDEFISNIYAQRVNDGLVGIKSRQQISPSKWTLNPAYPNPFNPTARISFEVPVKSSVQLIVYDILGREVAELVNKQLESGKHEVVWNGCDAADNPVSSGTYFYRLEADGVEIVRKAILIK